ncbi:metallophosphoesterase [Methylomonas sp. SURF-2]|uniref:Metallophosphoesterase n=1 Tax=Methylomonas subterranea TaxID=2952225 RepID=A0ABT1TDG4_9GAMM|nr:metallophosphoesterase [Methylomonas sp. SURF-2]MCQ8103493.1 metallophosphoesterase [Methylomonas sp. SURF-2]
MSTIAGRSFSKIFAAEAGLMPVNVKKPLLKNIALLAAFCTAGCVQPVLAGPQQQNAQGHGKFEFALIGDVPYNEVDFWKLDNVIAEINADQQLKWVLHAGDIKNGSTLCSDEMFLDRLQRFSSFKKPFILTPGDNEWTDCHRANNGGYQPLERLSKLREVFYPLPGQTLGRKTMRVETQADDAQYAEFVENVRWKEQNVMFATLHIVGSNNALANFAGRTAADNEEVVRRIEAARAWIGETFAKATAENARGVLLMFQANPGFELAKGNSGRRGFEEILADLEREIVDFKKPVALVHGDSHYFRVDKPMLGAISKRRIENATRIETFGADDVHWLRVEVDPNSAEVFSVHQEIVETNLEQHPQP